MMLTTIRFAILVLCWAPFCLYAQNKPWGVSDDQGAIIRGNTQEKTIYLTFTGHDFADGAKVVVKALRQHKAPSTFFFTGDFMRKFPKVVRQLRAGGHYVGPHSDKHLLYCDWTKRDSLLVTKEQFWNDMEANYATLARMGIPKQESSVFMAPYEWYNKEVASWCREMGLTLVNFTPGIGTNADYTTPDMPNYRSSQELYDRIFRFENQDQNGLNGAIMLIHIGADPKRTDKFYDRLSTLLQDLKGRGYTFQSLSHLL